MQEFSDMIDEILNGPKPEEGTLAAMYVQAVEDGCTNADGNCQNPNHLHIGDYVNFANPESGEATALATETGYESDQYYTIDESKKQLYWRVLGYDAEKMQVKLIAATPLKSDGSDGYLWMKGAQSYVTGYLVPDKISEKIYGNLPNVAEARSVKIEDINELVGIKTTEDIKKYNYFAFSIFYNYGDSFDMLNAWSPEDYLNSQITGNIEQDRGVSGKVDGYCYTVNGKMEENAPYVTLSYERMYDMIFNDTENGTGGGYWLSSRGISATSAGGVYFGLGNVRTYNNCSCVFNGWLMFESNTYGSVNEYELGFGIRPVVSLESGVKAEDVPKMADQVNPSWGDEN